MPTSYTHTGTSSCKWLPTPCWSCKCLTLYFRCDVFIENSKALIQQGSEARINSALQTLYTALEVALVVSHPFLPYITEELWQRLPRRPGDKTETIMYAKYPEWDQKLENPAAETAYDIVLGCSKGVRSLMAEYAPKDKARIFIHAHNETSHKTVSEEKSSIQSLSGKLATEIDILSPTDARPAGCVSFLVSSAVSVLIHVADRIDFDEEIAKATKKLEKARVAVEKQQKLINDPEYLQKANVVTQDADPGGKRIRSKKERDDARHPRKRQNTRGRFGRCSCVVQAEAGSHLDCGAFQFRTEPGTSFDFDAR